jgi:sensor domain CHASE-containing protein
VHTPFLTLALFQLLNLFIAIIVRTIQSYNEKVRQDTVQAIQDTQVQIEGNVCEELRWMRREIEEMEESLATGLYNGRAT